VVYDAMAQSLKVEELAVSDEVMRVAQGMSTRAAQGWWRVQGSEPFGV
jgi:hypothetical protein